VDVIINGNTPGGDGSLGTLARTLMQNVEVLSAGQDFKKDAEGKPIPVQVVNVLVTPEQAEQLSLASNMTTLQLVLRNPLDREVVQTPGTALAYLFTGTRMRPEGQAPAPAPRPRAVEPESRPPVMVAPPPPKKEPFVMEIIQGNKKNETKFENTGEGR
jgi:pilus assembly protein CpaB